MSWLRILQLAVAVGLFGLILWKSSLGQVGDVLGHADRGLLAAVIALNVPLAALYPLRSHLVLRRLGVRAEPRVLVPAMILGNVAGSLTPVAMGELLRATMLHSRADIAYMDSLALVLYERGLSFYLLAWSTGVAAAFITLPALAAVATAVVAAPLALLPAVAANFLGLLPRITGEDPRGALERLLRRLQEVADKLRSLLSDRGLLALWSLLTMATFAIATTQFWLLTRSLGQAVAPHEAWATFGVSQIAGIASLVPLGLGASDVSLAALLRSMGMTLEQGAAAAILVRATLTLPLGLAALASYLYLLRMPGRRESDAAKVSVDA